MKQVVSDDGDDCGNENVTEQHSEFGNTSQSSESENVRGDDTEGLHGSWTESDRSQNSLNISMSGNIFDDSLEAHGTALETSNQPSQPTVLSLVLLNLLMNISKNNLDSPNNSKKKGSESDGSNMNPHSPSERFTKWSIELISVWGEIPDAGNSCENELTDIVDESNVPQASE